MSLPLITLFVLTPNVLYEGGATLKSNYLLSSIKITAEAPDNIFRTYTFKYGTDNIYSYLNEVVEAGEVSFQTLNSTVFVYGKKPVNYTSSPISYQYLSYKDLFPGDFDGDGKSDLIIAQKYGYGHSSYDLVSQIQSSNWTTMYTKSPLASGSTVTGSYSEKTKNSSYALDNFFSSDYNGDGRDDVLYLNATNTTDYGGPLTTFNKLTIELTKKDANNQYYSESRDIYQPYDADYFYKYIRAQNNLFIPGDFDGDGNQDFILIASYCANMGCDGYKAFFSSPNTSETNLEILNFGVGYNGFGDYYATTVANVDYIIPIDYDGDGKQELFISRGTLSYMLSITRISSASGYSFSASSYEIPYMTQGNSKVYFGDFNGDRKGDLLIYKPYETVKWYTYYSTGTGFIPVPFSFKHTLVFNGDVQDDHIVIADYNGDGKSDILDAYLLQSPSYGTMLDVYYGKGYNPMDPSSSFFYEQYYYVNEATRLTAADFNGDGRSDLLYDTDGGLAGYIIFFKPFGREQLLASVTDGFNNTTSFEYKYLTEDPNFYSRTVSLDDWINNYPHNYIQLPISAVSKIKIPDGIGGKAITNFTYKDAILNRTGKGFLGFKNIIADNQATNITSETQNELNTKYAVLYPVKTKTYLGNTSENLSETQITTTFIDRGTGVLDKRFLQHVDKTLSIDYVNDRASESTNTYDNYGNITTNVTKTGILSGSTVTAIETVTTTTVFGSIQYTGSSKT